MHANRLRRRPATGDEGANGFVLTRPARRNISAFLCEVTVARSSVKELRAELRARKSRDRRRQGPETADPDGEGESGSATGARGHFGRRVAELNVVNRRWQLIVRADALAASEEEHAVQPQSPARLAQKPRRVAADIRPIKPVALRGHRALRVGTSARASANRVNRNPH